MLSAFMNVESIGLASDLLDALETIRQRHPNAPIFDSSICSEKKGELLTSLLNIGRSIIILRKCYSIRGRCVYIGGDIDFSKHTDFDWVVKAIGQIINEYHNEDARPHLQE